MALIFNFESNNVSSSFPSVQISSLSLKSIDERHLALSDLAKCVRKNSDFLEVLLKHPIPWERATPMEKNIYK